MQRFYLAFLQNCRRLTILFTVRSGSSDRSSGGSVHAVSSIVSHNLYSSNTLDYDIAVVRVLTAFDIGTSTVDLIRLPAAGSEPEEGVSALVSGWGLLTVCIFVRNATKYFTYIPFLYIVRLKYAAITSARCYGTYR